MAQPSAAEEGADGLDAAESEDNEPSLEGAEEFEDGYDDYDDFGEENLFAGDEAFADEAPSGVSGDEFSDFGEELEDSVARALAAENADEFFRALRSALERGARTARAAGRAAERVGRPARRAGRLAHRAARARSPVGFLLQQLGQYLNDGFDEFDALTDLVEVFEEQDFDESEIDAALPVLAGLAARAVAAPLIRRSAAALARPVARRLVRSLTGTARTLLRRRGPAGLRSLPGIAGRVRRVAARRRMPATALPSAVRSVAARVAGPARGSMRAGTPPAPYVPASGRGARGRMPGRLILQGPVEIRILTR
jgi:hypothetical protein